MLKSKTGMGCGCDLAILAAVLALPWVVGLYWVYVRWVWTTVTGW